MALDPRLYTLRRTQPAGETMVALVAYERHDGSWDAYVFEPPGVLPPEWEQARVDPDHVFLRALAGPAELGPLAEQVARSLGPAFEKVLAYREEVPGERVGINRALQWLHKVHATGYAARRDAAGRFELWARRKDLPVLARAGLHPPAE